MATGWNIKTAATTVLSSNPCTLRRLVFNNVGTTWVVTLYDNTAASGTVIATVTAPSGASYIDYDYSCGTGLTVKTAGTPGDITVLWS